MLFSYENTNHSAAKTVPARCGKRHTGAVHEILFVHGAGAVNAYWRLELP